MARPEIGWRYGPRPDRHDKGLLLRTEIAAEVFGLLDDGLNPVDIVTELHVSPERC